LSQYVTRGGSSEKKLEHDEERENYHVMERRYGSLQRSLRIPDTVDEEKIYALITMILRTGNASVPPSVIAKGSSSPAFPSSERFAPGAHCL
jgi:hypothetical protein